MNLTSAVFFLCAGIGLAGCGNTTTSGGDGLTMQGPSGTLTHGVCATFTLTHTFNAHPMPGVTDPPAAVTSTRSYTVTATNGTMYSDTKCTTVLSGPVTIPTGSTSADFGFTATAAGTACDVKAVDAAQPLITAEIDVTPN
jgi:hypothetical protein